MNIEGFHALHSAPLFSLKTTHQIYAPMTILAADLHNAGNSQGRPGCGWLHPPYSNGVPEPWEASGHSQAFSFCCFSNPVALLRFKTSWFRILQSLEGLREVLTDSEEPGFSPAWKRLDLAAMGSGLAPFVAFLRERSTLRKQGKKTGSMALYFGNRYEKKEFLMEEELNGFIKEGLLSTPQRAPISFLLASLSLLWGPRKIAQQKNLLLKIEFPHIFMIPIGSDQLYIRKDWFLPVSVPQPTHIFHLILNKKGSSMPFSETVWYFFAKHCFSSRSFQVGAPPEKMGGG